MPFARQRKSGCTPSCWQANRFGFWRGRRPREPTRRWFRCIGPAKSCHHFIRDEQRAMAARDVRHLPQPAAGLRNHSGRTLHQRLEDECGVGISASFLRGELLLHFADTFPVAFPIFARVGAFRLCPVERTAIAIRRHDLVRLEQHSGISLVEQINVAERNRADRVAVIRAVE